MQRRPPRAEHRPTPLCALAGRSQHAFPIVAGRDDAASAGDVCHDDCPASSLGYKNFHDRHLTDQSESNLPFLEIPSQASDEVAMLNAVLILGACSARTHNEY